MGSLMGFVKSRRLRLAMYGRLVQLGGLVLDIVDVWFFVKLDEVDINEVEFTKGEPNKDAPRWGCEWDPTCLVGEMEISRIPPNKGGRP
jgi:hypothetical protein